MPRHLVEEAATFLQSSSATPKEKLVIGGKLLWAAMMVSKDWTPELLDRAKRAYKFLFEHGTHGNLERSVKQMDEKVASRYLEAIHERCDATGDRHRAGQEPATNRTEVVEWPIGQPICRTAPDGVYCCQPMDGGLSAI